MAGARELKKPKSAGRMGAAVAAGVVAIAAAGYLGLCAWAGSAGVMPNVTVGGVEVAGLEPEQAQQVLEQALEQHGQKASVTLTYGDWSGSITADKMQTFGLDSALAAMQTRSSGFLAQGYEYIARMIDKGRTDVALDLGYDCIAQPALEALLDEAEKAIGCDAVRASYTVTDDSIVMTKGKSGLTIDREKAREEVYQAFYRDVLPGALQGAQTNGKVELVLNRVEEETPDFDAIWKGLCVEPQSAQVDPET